MNDRARRAAALRSLVLDIVGKSRRQPSPRQLVRELKREDPELLAAFMADINDASEKALMGHLMSNLSHKRQWPRLAIE